MTREPIPDSGRTSLLFWPRRVLLGAWLTVRGFLDDNGLDKAAGLAYVSLLSLVPLLAAAAVLYRSVFSAHTDKIVEMVTVILPYSSDKVQQTLTEFVDSATAIGGIGFVVFLAVAFRLFMVIETTLNQIWGVGAARSYTVRLFSFTMVIFWGPIVIGVGSTLMYTLERQPWAPSSALLIDVGRVIIPLIGLTMVYWMAPHTGVHWGNALIGGAVATTGLALLRAFFVAYLTYFPQINVIYGSLGLAIVFLVSLFAFWALVVLGAEASYVAQNLPMLARSARGDRTEPDPEPASLALLAHAYRHRTRHDPPKVEQLAADLGITERYARSLVERLVEARLLAVTGGEAQRYLPVEDADRLTLAAAADRLVGKPDFPDDVTATRIMQRLLDHLHDADKARDDVLDDTTFAQLIENDE